MGCVLTESLQKLTVTYPELVSFNLRDLPLMGVELPQRLIRKRSFDRMLPNELTWYCSSKSVTSFQTSTNPIKIPICEIRVRLEKY